jgi:hypothetical protein
MHLNTLVIADKWKSKKLCVYIYIYIYMLQLSCGDFTFSTKIILTFFTAVSNKFEYLQ